MGEKIKNFISRATTLLRLRTGYNRVFDENNLYTQIVLTDLRKFCPTDPTLNGTITNTNMVYTMIGRRQVLSRIQRLLNIPDERINQIAEAELKEKYNDNRE